MGLAPWRGHVWNTDDSKQLTSEIPDDPILKGEVYNDINIDKTSMMGPPFISRTDTDMFDEEGNMIRSKKYDFDDDDFKEIDLGAGETGNDQEEKITKQLPLNVAIDAIGLSSRIQTDLESVGMDFVKHFKEQTGQTNLCLAGGVALNSVLNGRLSRELGFQKFFIPPYPGDDGIAVGCCAYGLYGKGDNTNDQSTPMLWKKPLSPYLGPLYSEVDITEAISWAEPWLDVSYVRNETDRIDLIVKEIASSGVVALYTGRSELGPRALVSIFILNVWLGVLIAGCPATRSQCLFVCLFYAFIM